MLAEGDKIKIKHSNILEKRGCSNLVNKNATVTKIFRQNGKIVGVCANVKIMRSVKNYYIPVCSIVMPDEIDRTRTVSILKSTIL